MRRCLINVAIKGYYATSLFLFLSPFDLLFMYLYFTPSFFPFILPQVPCAYIDWSNMRIQARNDRHHWAFTPTSPKVPDIGAYQLGKTF